MEDDILRNTTPPSVEWWWANSKQAQDEEWIPSFFLSKYVSPNGVCFTTNFVYISSHHNNLIVLQMHPREKKSTRNSNKWYKTGNWNTLYLPAEMIESFLDDERIQKLIDFGNASDVHSKLIFCPIAAPTNWFWIIIIGGTEIKTNIKCQCQ